MQSSRLQTTPNIQRTIYALLLAGAIVLTLYPYEWFLGIDLFAGSLLFMLLVGLYPTRAVLGGAIITYGAAWLSASLEWLPALLYTCQVAWLCWFIRKQPQGLIFGSALYWIAAGGPLLAAHYMWQNGRFDQVGLILLQTEFIVALVCALLADICLAYVPFNRFFAAKQQPAQSGYHFSRMMLHLTLVVLLIPYLFYITYTGQKSQAAGVQSIENHFRAQMQTMQSYLDTMPADTATALRLESGVEAALLSKRLQALASDSESEYLILTEEDIVLAASSAEFPQLGEPFTWRTGSQRIIQRETFWQWLPKGTFTHEIERYRHAYVIHQSENRSAGMKLILMMPFTPYAEELLSSYETKLSLVLNLSLFVLLLSWLFNRIFFQPLDRLAAATTGIPSRLQTGTSIDWKKSGLIEIDVLINNFRTVTAELREMFEHTHQLAYYDSLTGLPNRLSMQKELERMFQNRHHSAKAAVIFFDLDRFKQINDSLGHALGDQLLQVIAQRLTLLISKRVRLFRISGDEFVIILERNTENPVETAAEAILRLIRQPIRIESHELRVTSSVGIALYPEHGQTANQLMKQADSAMYAAKESGGDSYALYTHSLETHISDKLWLENHLRSALENQQFVLHYQPIVDGKSGRICGVEALIRWHHPEQGVISPARFVPVAEQTGIIIPIGEWVLREACKQNKAWQDAGLEPIRVAVNLSARQFHSPHLIEHIRSILDETGLSPHYLELEITEGFIIHNSEYVRQALRELEAMGVTVSIDDFGTGYSSLSQLQRLPVHAVKIDRTFVRNIGENAHNSSIVRAVIELAHGMGLKVVAEGIETEEERDFLIRYNCDKMQGYWLGRPTDAVHCEQILRQLRQASTTNTEEERT